MRKVIASTAIFFTVIGLVSLGRAQNATETVSSGRKVILRIAPTCPDLARRLHIQGPVKLEAVVRPNGSVKQTRALGGNPVLVDAAIEAVSKWKFETGPNETKEVIQLMFVAQ
jgi:TonB family protein